jgi:hypothetical protein
MELEPHPPIAADHDGPTTAHFAFEWMQAEAGNVHVGDGPGGIQGSQLHSEPLASVVLTPEMLPVSKSWRRSFSRNEMIMLSKYSVAHNATSVPTTCRSAAGSRPSAKRETRGASLVDARYRGWITLRSTRTTTS